MLVLTDIVDRKDATVQMTLPSGLGVACNGQDGATRAIGSHQMSRSAQKQQIYHMNIIRKITSSKALEVRMKLGQGSLGKSTVSSFVIYVLQYQRPKEKNLNTKILSKLKDKMQTSQHTVEYSLFTPVTLT